MEREKTNFSTVFAKGKLKQLNKAKSTFFALTLLFCGKFRANKAFCFLARVQEGSQEIKKILILKD